ncbi:MAG: TetR/AcrR family transcriptional regulator [Phenylobacterium sp.]|nr:MAG: TetR/AcrR family transcriptional regulator [Phenylobacterium sp.]
MEETSQKTNRRRRTQAERREESERGLVKAAVALVSEEGVSASTFEAIARRSGYSRGLVGQRFGSKLGLVEAVITYLHDGRENFAEARKLDGLPGLEALVTYADHYLQRLSHMGEVRAYFRLLSWAVADISAFRSVFAVEHDRIRGRFEGWIRQGQAEGQIRADLDAAAAALMVGGQLLGLSIQVLIDPAMDLDPIRATYLATLRQAFSS